MKRRTFDILVSTVGLVLAVVLVVSGGLLTWANRFVSGEVHDQLAAQEIYFPPADSPAVADEVYEPMRQYGGQKLTTGEQAETYANHFIKPHLDDIGGGKTYAQLSGEAQENPDDAEMADRVEQMFRGETLRGLLLNAYAFGTMARIAGIAAYAAFAGAAVFLILGALGLRNAARTPDTEDLTLPLPGDTRGS